ncbi:MAG: SDR family NAD(P)-dependent oxidoreductase [Pseudomonadota bacterium]
MKDISGSVAVVTGASEGIGRAIARALAARGARVALVARSAEKLVRACDDIAGETHAFSANLAEAGEVRRALAEVVAKLGPVDILVNNVGGGTFKPLDQQSDDEVMLPIGLPLTAAIVACHAVVPEMKRRGRGHIVTLTSPAGYVPFPFMMPYTATRHAMVGLALSLNEELKGTGAGSTLFCPAQVDTGYFERNDADMSWYPRVSKMLPVLQPDSVGEQVVRAIEKNRREVIYPRSLWLFLRTYQRMPGLSLALLKLSGLWRPAR